MARLPTHTTSNRPTPKQADYDTMRKKISGTATFNIKCLQIRSIDTSSLVLIVHNLNIALAAHDDGTLAVDGIRNNVEDSLDLAIEHTSRRNATSLLSNHSHGNALVQTTELSFWRLVVSGVEEDTSVQKSTVDIGNHGTDVTRRVGLGSLLEDGNGLLDGFVPVVVVTLVTGEDGLAAIGGELHVDASVDELTDGGIEAETVDSATLEGEDKLNG
mmetsp:Transcript_34142/g.68828  ORF Transcript_34142/g.68828 Transcript_34142/m.68828 type:complete len:216 (-) Transcript_34142:581-1228(-)